MAEAWEWERIECEACPFCGLCPSAVAIPVLGELALVAADDWARDLATADAARLRLRPAPDVWSPLEYALHVRDMFDVFGGRIRRVLAEDDPVFQWSVHDPEGTYNLTPPEHVAAEVVRAATEFASAVALPGDWTRTGRRNGPGEEGGTVVFTAAGLACFALHEAHHHRLDVAQTCD